MTTTMSSGPQATEVRDSGARGVLRMPELWGAIAIAAMWVAVLFDGVYGHDFVSVNGAGSQTTTIPSAVFVAFFASLATISVARRAFARGTGSNVTR
jgi:hypothetical protein